MSFARGRAMWKPDLARGQDPAVLNDEFRAQAERFRFQFQCPDCAFVAADGSCVTRWPNARLLRDPVQALDDRGDPVFCKSFEADAF